MFLGAFCPLVDFPSHGSFNLLRGGPSFIGLAILAFAAAGMFFAFRENAKALRIVGAVSLGIITWVFFSELNSLRLLNEAASLLRELGDSRLPGTLQFGWGLLTWARH